MAKKTVILVSGGLDSATCLAIAQAEGFACYVLSFNYGQKSQAELAAAIKIAQRAQVAEHRIVQLDLAQQLLGSALTDQAIAVPAYQAQTEIPVTYVPARNTIFLSIALGWAEALGAQSIFIGANAVDYSGYPDCRPEYIAAYEKMANLATKSNVTAAGAFRIHAPLLYLSKADIIRKGHALNVDYSLTVSCYQADAVGRACGQCDSCHFRKQGFTQAGLPDPTHYYSA